VTTFSFEKLDSVQKTILIVGALVSALLLAPYLGFRRTVSHTTPPAYQQGQNDSFVTPKNSALPFGRASKKTPRNLKTRSVSRKERETFSEIEQLLSE